MGWIFGFFGNVDSETIDKFSHIHPDGVAAKANNFYVACGGHHLTHHLFSDKVENKGIAVSGLGIIPGSDAHYLEADDWEDVCDDLDDLIPSIDGHYAIVSWNQDNINVYTDPAGLRDIYYVKFNNGYLFSTRCDWLSALVKPIVDYSVLGARWLMQTNVSTNPLFSNYGRLVSGKSLTLNRNTFEESYKEFTIDYNFGKTFTEDDLYNMVLAYITLPQRMGKKLSLGLSGGLDSRFLLSFLLKHGVENWDTHTFGADTLPDYKLAKQMSDKLSFVNYRYNIPEFKSDDIISDAKEYTGTTLFNASVSAIIQLNNYKLIANNDEVVIDGCCAEFARREFFFKMAFKAKSGIENKSIDAVYNNLALHRADIFNDDYLAKMQQGTKYQIGEIINDIPDATKIGVDNWLDIFAAKIKLPNQVGVEQTRLDGMICSFMPFVQADFLKNMTAMDESIRKNSKLLKTMIVNNVPELGKFPLVKGIETYPFNLSSFQSRLYQAVKSKILKNKYKDNRVKLMLTYLKDFVYDTVNSASFANFEGYNHQKIKNIVDGYYGGDFSYERELDWFLSFEFFRISNHL